MRNQSLAPLFGGLLILLLSSCGDTAKLDVKQGIGPNPTLPAPHHTLIPTLKIAPAIGWPAGVTPTAAAGLRVRAFASGLDHPRWLYVLPNGDVLVAETNAPPKPYDDKGIRGATRNKNTHTTLAVLRRAQDEGFDRLTISGFFD